MALLTLNKLCELVGQDRRAIAPLLETVPYTAGPNRSHLYESQAALQAIYRCRHKDSGPEFSLAEAKIRNEMAAAKLREVTVSQKLDELVLASISRLAINAFITYVRSKFEELRRRGAVDYDWINSCGRAFAGILADLTVTHGIEFAKAIFTPEDLQQLKLDPPMKKNRTATADKLDDPISRKALRDAIRPLFDKHFAPWTPTEREKTLFKVATGLEMAAQGIRDLLKSEYLQG